MQRHKVFMNRNCSREPEQFDPKAMWKQSLIMQVLYFSFSCSFTNKFSKFSTDATQALCILPIFPYLKHFHDYLFSCNSNLIDDWKKLKYVDAGIIPTCKTCFWHMMEPVDEILSCWVMTGCCTQVLHADENSDAGLRYFIMNADRFLNCVLI